MTGPREVVDWDRYFLDMCKDVAKRSKDPSTQHGAIVVNRENIPLGTGYNGGPCGIDDKELDWGRPAKYEWVIHAEENALWFARRARLKGCTIYVTGRPCSKCIVRIIHRGIRRCVYGGLGSAMIDEKELATGNRFAALAGLEMIQIV